MRTEEREVDEGTLMQFEKGYLWERVLSRSLGKRAPKRIGEIELDGIILTPDGVTDNGLPPYIIILEEDKCTLTSAAKPVTDNWKWMMQVKGYCKALSALKCIMRVFYLRGDYTNGTPSYGVFELIFTQGELDENWQAVLNHAKTMRR